MDKEPKKQYKVNSKPIISVLLGLAFFTGILIITLMETAKEIKPVSKPSQGVSVKDKGSEEETSMNAVDDKEILAIVKAVDKEGHKLTLFDIEKQEEEVIAFTGGSDIRDKYDQVIAISQIPVGTMVDVGLKNSKLVKLQVSARAWEYFNVNNFTIDPLEKIITIAKIKYKYTDDLVVLNEGAFVTIHDLAKQDELTIRGYDQTVWSIEVTRGHGTVRITDQEAFLGGSIAVGYEAMQQVTEDLVLTVREGIFNLTVENGDYSGTKNITVYRNQETNVSLSDLGPGAEKRGRITFDINPFGADLFIDGELVSYANPIELTYGAHDIEVSLGGYTTYKGILDVDVAGKKMMINLPEKASSDAVDVTETGDESLTETVYNDWELPSPASTEAEETGEESGQNTEEEYIVDEEHLIYVQNPEEASVYLNGDFLGISPGSFPKIIGRHVLTFIKEGYETRSYTIEIMDDGLDAYLSMPDLEEAEE